MTVAGSILKVWEAYPLFTRLIWRIQVFPNWQRPIGRFFFSGWTGFNRVICINIANTLLLVAWNRVEFIRHALSIAWITGCPSGAYWFPVDIDNRFGAFGEIGRASCRVGCEVCVCR